MFGFVYPIKGIEYAIKSLEFLKNRKDILLIIAGQTLPKLGEEYVRNLKALIRKYGTNYPDININFINRFISDEEIKLLFNAVDIVLLTYTENYGSSGPLHQAAGYGKGIIAFDVGYYLRDAIDKNIILCPNKNVKCLAKTIDYYFDNPEILKNLCQKILEYSKRETWKKCAERTLDYYKKIFNQK